MDFRLNDEQLEFQQTLPQRSRARSSGRSPPSTTASRACRGTSSRQPASGTSTGSTTSSGWAATPTGCSAASTPRSCTGAAPASRSPSRPPRSPPPASPPPARPSRSAAGCPSASATGDEIKLGAYAVTEAGAGSDVKSLRTTAKLDGDEWVLNGTKVFISNGGIADVTVVVATVDPELGHRGQASFVVPKDTPGLSLGKKEDKLGIRASQTAEVVLEDCRDPDGLPARRAGQARQEARARPLGPVDRPLLRRARDVRDHPPAGRRLGARHRPGRLRVDARVPRGQVEDGTPLLEQQRIQQTLADVATEIEAARLLVLARRLDGPQRHADDRRPGLDVEAQGRRRDDVGHDHADGPRRPLRADAPTARSRSGSATPRSTSCSRARPRCSGWSSRACSAPSTSSGSRPRPRSRTRTARRSATSSARPPRRCRRAERDALPPRS